MAGIYVHIPFCKSRCVYCGFFSTTQMEMRQRYVDALCRELELRKDYLGGQHATTIYIGGGTPSVLEPEQLQQIVTAISPLTSPSHLEEFTVECNPDDVTPALAKNLRRLGVSRVSMGVQTFSDQRLRFLHRRHTAATIAPAVKCLRKAGICNISIDLIYGFPGESLDDWRRDVYEALALGVEHISAYSLQYEEDTPLSRMLDEGRIAEVDEEVSLAMFEHLTKELTAHGYEHYEISNFARPGYRSRHNSSYWHQTPYLGLGAAAHSYNGITRQWNVASLKEYIEGIEQGEPRFEQEELDVDTLYNELVMTRLRTCEGLPLPLLTESQRQYCLCQAQRYLDDGLLSLTSDNHLRLTHRGIFVSDMIMSDLMLVRG